MKFHNRKHLHWTFHLFICKIYFISLYRGAATPPYVCVYFCMIVECALFCLVSHSFWTYCIYTQIELAVLRLISYQRSYCYPFSWPELRAGRVSRYSDRPAPCTSRVRTFFRLWFARGVESHPLSHWRIIHRPD